MVTARGLKSFIMPRKPRALFLFDLWEAVLGVFSLLVASFFAYALLSLPSVREVSRSGAISKYLVSMFGMISLMCLGLAFRVRIARFVAMVLACDETRN
jgi:hypothetical protein